MANQITTKAKITIALILALVFLLFSGAFAQEKPGDSPPKEGKRKRHYRKHRNFLKLTSEQKQKLKTIRMKYQNLQEDLMFDIQRKRFELADALRKEEPDRKLIDKKLAKLMSLETKRQKYIIDEYFEIKQILNPQQNKFFLRKLIRAMLQQKRPRKH